ncbi:MAG: ATP-binding protein [Bacteroidales bacterium]
MIENSTIEIPERFKNLIKQDEPFEVAIKNAKLNIERIVKEFHNFFFPEYTNHGIYHINQLLKSADSLITDEAIKLLDSKNISVLIISIFVHDIGMCLNISHFKYLINSDTPILKWDKISFKDLWLEYINGSRHWTQEQKLNILGVYELPKDICIDTDLTNDLKRFIGEFIRRNHPRIAHEILFTGFKINESKNIKIVDLSFFEDLIQGISNRYKFEDICGLIARSHGINFREANNHFKDIDSHNWMDFLNVKTTYLMAVLRIADYILIDSDRIFSSVYSFRNIKSPISFHEFKKHESIIKSTKSRLDKESIRFIVNENINNDLYNSIVELLKNIQSELDLTWAILSEAYGFYSDLLNLKLTIRRVSSNILESDFGKDRDIVFGETKLILTPNLLPLLGRKLYTSKISTVRELIQNSFDACIIRESHNKKIESNIYINLTEDAFSITDNGIGMDYDDISEYLLKIGKSSKIKQYKNEGIVGFFGIGILSIFNIGTSAKITTRKQDSSYTYELTLSEKTNLDQNLDVKIIHRQIDLNDKIQKAVGTEIIIKLLPGAYKEILNSLNSEYFHYVGKVKICFSGGVSFFAYNFSWRVLESNKNLIQWNYRDATKGGLVKSPSNYINSFLVQKFKIYNKQNKSLLNDTNIVFNVIDKTKACEINLSREEARLVIQDNFENILITDIYIDLYLYLLLFNKDKIVNVTEFSFPIIKGDRLVFFNKGYSILQDCNLNLPLIFIVLKNVSGSKIKKILDFLPDNFALLRSKSTLEYTSYFKKDLKDEKDEFKTNSIIYKLKKSKFYNEHRELLDKIGIDNINYIVLNNHVKNGFFHQELYNSNVKSFKNSIIPYDNIYKSDIFNEFIETYQYRYSELRKKQPLFDKIFLNNNSQQAV